MDIKETIKKMTLDEKISILIGKDFWQTLDFEKYGIPSLFMSDGPSGLRKQEFKGGSDMLGVNKSRKATCYPSTVTLASTWDRELLFKQGKAISSEAIDQNVGMVLGPGINIKRNPLCGRNFEYYSEDPILSGELAAEYIKGLQSEGIACSLKHFACNSQELDRFQSNGIIDERALREIYLRGFEIAVKNGKPKTIMSSYPSVNGVHSSDSKVLLNDILREEWGFDGLVVSDWGGMNDRVEAIKAGNDLCMPGGSNYMHKEVKNAVKDGRLLESDIDKCVYRVIKLALEGNEALKNAKNNNDYKKNHDLAVEIAENGAVLLKNDDNLLPLKKESKVLVVGAMANKPRFQGAGSSHINPMNLVTPLDIFKDYEHILGVDDKGDTNEELLLELREKGEKCDSIVIFAGLPEKYESEGYDRTDFDIPDGHIRMIEEACKVNKNVVVLLLAGAPIKLPFIDKVKSVIYLGLPGEGIGEAAFNLVFGIANPSGHLTETWVKNYIDVPSSAFYLTQTDALYMESIYVGYRYYDKKGLDVRFPFGYGLSYSNFSYSNFELKGDLISLDITNDSDIEGSTVVQIYVGSKEESFRAIKELKHFEKVRLNPHETKNVSFKIGSDDFTIFNKGWKVIKGEYIIYIAKNVNDIIHTFSYTVNDGYEMIDCDIPWYIDLKGDIDRKSWEKLLGYEVKEKIPHKKGEYTMEDSVAHMKESSLIMKLLYKIIEKIASSGFNGIKDENNPEYMMLINSSVKAPLRAIGICGGIPYGVIKALLKIANGFRK